MLLSLPIIFMPIRIDEYYFKTHLALDPPNFFNSATNVLFKPLQHLIGQNKYQSLNGRVSPIQPDAVSPSSSLKKAIVWACAFFLAILLTLPGCLTRYVSLRSSDVEQAYYLAQLLTSEQTPDLIVSAFAFVCKKKEAERHQLLNNPYFPSVLFLSQKAHQTYTNAYLDSLDETQRASRLAKLPPEIQWDFLSLEKNQAFSLQYLKSLLENEFTQLTPGLPPVLLQAALIERKPVVVATDPAKTKSVNAHLSRAITSLKELQQKIQEGEDLAKKLEEYRTAIFYPSPFLIPEHYPKFQQHANPQPGSEFSGLYKASFRQLLDDLKFYEKQLLEATRQNALELITTTKRTNEEFFTQLDTWLKSSEDITIWLKLWLEVQLQDSYPFYTLPLILKFQNSDEGIAQIEKHKTTLIEEKHFPIEDPPSEDVGMKALKRAMDQLENIKKLEEKIVKVEDLSKKLEEYLSAPFYPFPFLIAKHYPKLQQWADPELGSQFSELYAACSRQLPPALKWDEKQLLEATRQNAFELIATTKRTNEEFFTQLDARLKSSEDIFPWLEAQLQNSYPFYTLPLILKFQNTDEFIAQIEKYKTTLFDQRFFPIEDPPSDDVGIQALKRAMDQLENIAKLQKFIESTS